ncbi:hypothetical protein C7212DRAFT_342957 [Tuber magnatum]|uniref:Uncharacterized protein n=1 Tax=Tuber magnatum TaxID=42249 RepID=A0A317STQ6_9PEZI|nr:hypothetical protein C7212DRAFT_342957 [Tuber magnatum]
MAGHRMSQVTHVSQTVYTDDAVSTIPNSPGTNVAAQRRAELRQRNLERLAQGMRAAGDGVERDCVVKPILKTTEPLLHFLCDMRELLEDRLGEQDGKLDNVHDVASQALLGTNALDVRMQALESKVDAMESGVRALGSRMDALGPKVDAMESEVRALGSRMDALESKVDAMESEVRALGSRMDALDSRVEALDSKVDANHKEAMAMFGQVLASIKGKWVPIDSDEGTRMVFDIGKQQFE